jgi:hypothetical protein
VLLTKSLLRSVIRFEDEHEELISNNLYMLRQEVEPPGVDNKILEFVSDIYDRTKAIPRIDLLQQAFSDDEHGKRNDAVLARLGSLTNGNDPLDQAKFLYGPDFRYQLDQYKNRLMRDTIGSLLVESSSILSGGVRKAGRLVEGPEEAISHIQATLGTLNSTLKRGSVEGSFRRDATKVRKQYEHWKATPSDTVGILTGLDRIDMVHRGARNGDLILVAGFVAHLKSTFVLNWLYKSAIHFGRNSAIASLETPIDTLRMSIYVMHSSHPKFQERNMPALDYEKVTSGALDGDEENTLDAVIEDLKDNPEYGEILYKEPQDSLTISEIQRWAESKHKTNPLDFLVIDYLGLVDSGKGASSLDSMASLNKAIRQSKMMAMTFSSGRGIPVVSPFQTNREGLKEAEKNGGRYKLTALAGANEAERSADLVYYTYLDDVLRNSRELVVGNLKARSKPVLPDQFKVYADPSTRTIDNLEVGGAGAASLVTL